MMPKVTKAGHDPEALAVLVGAVSPWVEEAYRARAAVEIFSVLHDAGLRLVPSDDYHARAAAVERESVVCSLCGGRCRVERIGDPTHTIRYLHVANDSLECPEV